MPKAINQELTTREKQALLFYKKHYEKFRKAPTLRELADYLGVYQNAAGYIVKKLEEKGFVEKGPVTVMRLKLSDKGKKVGP